MTTLKTIEFVGHDIDCEFLLPGRYLHAKMDIKSSRYYKEHRWVFALEGKLAVYRGYLMDSNRGIYFADFTHDNLWRIHWHHRWGPKKHPHTDFFTEVWVVNVGA